MHKSCRVGFAYSMPHQDVALLISSIVSIAVLQGPSKTFWHRELNKNMVYPVLSWAAVSQSQGFISVS